MRRNLIMRLKIISEVFNAQYTSDITEISDLGRISYEFKDEQMGANSPIYTVSIDIEDIDEEDIGELIPVPERLENKFKKFKKKEIAEVTLKWRKPGEKSSSSMQAAQHAIDSFKPSNLGNQYRVYSKMLACLEQYTRDYGSPLFVEFTGSDDKMDLVYERMLKQQAKRNPKLAYVPYSHGIFIHLPVVQYLKSGDLDRFIDKQVKQRTAELELKRKNK